MSVRSAVEAVEAATPERVPVSKVIADAIERQADTLSAVLPETMSPERFEQITLAAIKGTPDLVKCFETPEGRASVLFGVIQAAGAGLEINSVAKEAWLIPRNVSFKTPQGAWAKRWEATLQLDYRGVKKLARRSPDVLTILADVVREGDHFRRGRGLDGDFLEHEPADNAEGRKLTHAYAIVRYANGSSHYVVMDESQIAKRRAMSQSYQSDLNKEPGKRKSPWSLWEAEMWAKTAIHAIKRDIDLSPDVLRVLEADDQVQRYNESTGEIEGAGHDVPDVPSIERGEPSQVPDDDDPSPTEPPDPEPEPEPEPVIDVEELPGSEPEPEPEPGAVPRLMGDPAVTWETVLAALADAGLKTTPTKIKEYAAALDHHFDTLKELRASPEALNDLHDWTKQHAADTQDQAD